MQKNSLKKAAFAARMLTLAGALLLPGYAHALRVFMIDHASHVSDSVTNNNNGTWTYDFTVHNDSKIFEGTDAISNIVDWELPYFTDAGIINIQSPFGWEYAIEKIGTVNTATGWNGVADWQTPGDPFYQGADSPFTTATLVLHWYINDRSPIAPGSSLGGFSFDAGFGSTSAPYQASWEDNIIRTGDPAFPGSSFDIPASPSTVSAVPVPAAVWLFGSGLMGVLGINKRKQVTKV